MSTTLDAISDRVRSLLVADLAFVESQDAFSFDLQPSGSIDGVFRVLSRAQRVVGGFRFTEERTDQVLIWVAKTMDAEPHEATRVLQQQMHSITAAVTRDGHITTGLYSVPDEGRTHDLRANAGAAFAILQLTLPVNYETQL